MRTILPAILLILTGCAPGGIIGKGPVETSIVDGEAHRVQRLSSGKDAWAATPANIWGGPINPADYVGNVKAIEAVSKCKVIRDSIMNQGMSTYAQVRCLK